MNYYIDIQASTEDGVNAAFEAVHCALQGNSQNIGISFPKYQYDPVERIGVIGFIVRLFSQQSDHLIDVIEHAGVQAISGITITPVGDVPEAIKGYAYFRRIQNISNSKQRRIAKRMVERGQAENIKDALSQIQLESQYNPYPSLRIKSLSRKTFFHAHILRQWTTNPIQGAFNAYGLCTKGALSTVPIF